MGGEVGRVARGGSVKGERIRRGSVAIIAIDASFGTVVSSINYSGFCTLLTSTLAGVLNRQRSLIDALKRNRLDNGLLTDHSLLTRSDGRLSTDRPPRERLDNGLLPHASVQKMLGT